MFDSVSWGELTVVIGLGLFVIGKKDLPKAAHMAGTQVGRVVGLLQGARARADRFAAHNELRQLQRELQSGLRELDLVKSELAVSMSGRTVGGGLSSMGPASSSRSLPSSASLTTGGPSSLATGSVASSRQASLPETPRMLNNMETLRDQSANDNPLHHQPLQRHHALPPPSQTIAAVAQEEWAKQGIAFTSKAELGAGLQNYDASGSGSVLLANMIQQSLIFDQYDRAVAQQDQALQLKMQQAQEKVQRRQKGEDKGKAR